MSGEPPDVDERRRELAEAFDRDLDPLARVEEQLVESDVDLFELFFVEVLKPDDPDESTIKHYRITFDQWRDYMAEQGRHPACPSERHVKGFIRHLLADRVDGGLGNSPQTVRQKLRRLGKLYRYWQREAPFPHGQDYNPIVTAIEKVDIGEATRKEFPRIELDELRDRISAVTHYRKRAILLTQLKLGLRLGEVTNIQIRDLHIENAELQRHYRNLGTHPRLEDRTNAIYIPSSKDRDGNKSERPRVLPLDDELRHVLLRYLLVRPDNGEPWLFLTLKTHGKITDHETINGIWREAFHPEYAETADTKGVTSHFGRHRFSTWWRVQQDLNREKLAYMRGDADGTRSIDERSAMDTYLHTYYEDIEGAYREGIFKLGL